MRVNDAKAEELRRYKLNNGDILIARRGDLSKCAIVSDTERNWLCGTGSFFLHVPLILPQYIEIFYTSEYVQSRLKQECVGATMDNLNQSVLGSISFLLPPLAEQKRIIDAVGRWYSLIDILENEQKDMAITIQHTKSKILDLAIHGKLVPQDPNDEPAIELLKRINPKFTPCDNEHERNQIPENWYWTTLSNVCELITGSTPSKNHQEYYGGDFPFYKPSDLDAGRHVTIPSEYLTSEGKAVSRIIPVESTAICCIGSIGKCGFIEKEGTTNQQINTAVPTDCLYPLYLYYFCNTDYFIDELKSDSSAITIAIVNKSKLGKMLIPIPPYNEQLRIVSKIEELFAVIDEIQKSIEA